MWDPCGRGGPSQATDMWGQPTTMRRPRLTPSWNNQTRREIEAFHGKVKEEVRAASPPRVPTATVQLAAVAEEGGGIFPVVVSTWPFREAVRAAWEVVSASGGAGGSAVDAVVAGCSACEVLRCDGTVGPGGSPDENGETTLDALIMDGTTMEIGAVAAMRYVKDGIKAAKLVMDHTEHTFLVGEKATSFAISMGLAGPADLSSPESIEKWTIWRRNHCQPNFWKNVVPAGSCGPYHPIDVPSGESKASAKRVLERTQGDICQGLFEPNNLLEPMNSRLKSVTRHNHDTISMAVIDKMGRVAAGTSTNGATFKIPGRVGDGPIPGSSAYADDEVGACGATGDGDIMMRFLPWLETPGIDLNIEIIKFKQTVVESMRRGMEPRDAAIDAILRIARRYPDFVGAVFAINKKGVHAGACHGWTFQYSVRNSSMQHVEVITVAP
uniref:beta-aspartyl-peptidase n=1 Tax=Oryza punctata TaxID=4537 RepID=A0A0E0KTJ3_ORYPU